jgi:hypothetical protein
MIRLRTLPDIWQATLFEIHNIIPDYELVIAGGAIRDLLLNTQPVKDLDIFVLGADEVVAQKLTLAFHTVPDARYMEGIHSGRLKYAATERGPYSADPVWRWPAVKPLGATGPTVDLVAMAEVPNVNKLLSGFDLNLVQVAHDGRQFIIHDNFVEGVEQRTIRVLDDGYPENSRARVARLSKKLPDFAIDLSILN